MRSVVFVSVAILAIVGVWATRPLSVEVALSSGGTVSE